LIACSWWSVVLNSPTIDIVDKVLMQASPNIVAGLFFNASLAHFKKQHAIPASNNSKLNRPMMPPSTKVFISLLSGREK
jgi:hypothetical protein